MSFDPALFDQQVFGAESFTCVFDKAIFDGAVFDTCEDVAPDAEPAALPAVAGIVRRRRRYIMPDDTMLEATTEEAVAWLRAYSTPAPAVATAHPSTQAMRMPPIVLEKRDIRFVPAEGSAPETWKAVISERFAFKAPPGAHRHAEILANRMRTNNNEATMVLLLWH